VAATLTLNSAVSATQLADGMAAVQLGPPSVANGVPLTLSSLLDAGQAANLIGGMDPLSFFGAIASAVGGAARTADDWKDRSTNLLNQAKAMRQELSGVSLDTEAVKIVELQRGYQAVAKTVGIIDEMMQTVIGMIR